MKNEIAFLTELLRIYPATYITPYLLCHIEGVLVSPVYYPAIPFR